MPETHKELMDCLHEFDNAGFPGCMGSSDTTDGGHDGLKV
jgi:hypothetical protein